jgi:hypothetical protein
MADSYRERLAKKAQAHKELTERDPEKLKQWYELAGEAAEDPDSQLKETARIINSEQQPKTPKSTGGGGGASFDENTIVPEAGTAINVKSNRNLVPKLPLGKAKHREIYSVTEATRTAQSKGRETPTQEELDYHAREWDTMPNESKLSWQQSPHGKKATDDAVNARVIEPKTEQRRVKAAGEVKRATIVKTAFDNSDAEKRFKETGELLDENGDTEKDWRKPWALTALTSQASRHGESRKVILGKAIHTDAQHHQALSDHIDELVNRSSSSAPAHLQGNQFNVKDGLANAAKESLARSAMAHALGMKDAALSHFRAAVTHAGDLAQAVHGVNSQPLGDWDKQDGIQSKYVKSVNEAK